MFSRPIRARGDFEDGIGAHGTGGARASRRWSRVGGRVVPRRSVPASPPVRRMATTNTVLCTSSRRWEDGLDEDEKYAYLAVSRAEPKPARARLLRPTRVDKTGGEFDVCRDDGVAITLGVRRRDKAAYKTVKKLRAGDAAPDELLDVATPV